MGVFCVMSENPKGVSLGGGLAAAASGASRRGDELFSIIKCGAGRVFVSLRFI